MRSTFYGIEIARTGVMVSQKGLDVTGHNIANVDTAGYTRQRLVTTAYDPYSATMKFKSVELGAVGGGSRVMILDQIRSSFLDRQYRTQQTQYSYWSTRTQGLTYVEALFEGEESASINQGILDLFNAFNTLATEANDGAQREVVQSAGQALCDSLNQIYDRLVEQQENQNLAVETVVKEINDIAENIAQLNKAIYYYELDGQPANDLRDKRNLLLDQLSELADITYKETDDNKLVVTLAGEELVNYTTTKTLSTQERVDALSGSTFSDPCWIDDTTDPPTVTVLDADDFGGELGAHLNLRDNDTSSTPGIPYFMEQLNILARAIVETVNAVHSQGYTHPASGSESVTGINFFDMPDDDLSKVTAGNISLSAEVLDNIYNIAASTVKIVLAAPDGDNYLQEGNQNNAKLLYGILNQTDIELSDGTSIGGLRSFIDGIVLKVATTLKQSKDYESNHQTQLLSVDTQRQSVSGVSLDEEMTNLIKYQHAYSGAARVMTAMDEALETLINKMGRVGL